ncbi:hypothetical protein EYV94_03345 [Puteibacter caeruleilacunae]|nr:hypothetical protein EYV94_03345 [Puteibacter caeruleilacunae]
MKYILKSLTLVAAITTMGSCSAHDDSHAHKKEGAVEITTRLSAQQDVATADQIIDNTWIVVGNKAPDGIVTREEVDNKPIYHFQATGKANRIEFTSCFGNEKDLKGKSKEEIELLKAIKSAYEYSDQGNYGETVTYEWKALFPEKMEKGKGAIFAQWHGRPDRTLVKDPNGNMKHWDKKAFVSMLDTMYFEKNIGISKKTGKPNGWIVEQSAGGPIGAFHFREDYMYLMIRGECNRMSDPTFKVKPKPGQHLNKVIGRDGKYGTIVFERPSSEIPINEWINFKVRIKYSKYSLVEDKTLETGSVEVWMNGEKVADWKGDVGKNDKHGPYFKFGIYKPGPNGFKVDCSEYKQTIHR